MNLKLIAIFTLFVIVVAVIVAVKFPREKEEAVTLRFDGETSNRKGRLMVKGASSDGLKHVFRNAEEEILFIEIPVEDVEIHGNGGNLSKGYYQPIGD